MDTTGKISERTVIDCRGIPLRMGRVPLIMGVVNVTPDSFSDGGRFLDVDTAVAHAVRLAGDGADVIDVGGESTRPGSDAVSIDRELARVRPVLETLVREIAVPISIDTRNAPVAEAALDIGCHLVNDISACGDESMPEVLCKYDAPVVLMHMKGEPKTMQENPVYADVLDEVSRFLDGRAHRLIERGVSAGKIIVDPGIGFGKRFRDNLTLLNNIGALRSLGYPVLVGASRKRFLGEILNEGTGGRLFGGLAVAARCYENGIEMIRVHDVKATRDLLTVMDALERPDRFSAR
jgi:dihydropteroate synthase